MVPERTVEGIGVHRQSTPHKEFAWTRERDRLADCERVRWWCWRSRR